MVHNEQKDHIFLPEQKKHQTLMIMVYEVVEGGLVLMIAQPIN